ncbi:SDR family NAD(P)-dependent oxidoreductase [Streptomyces sp. M10(2022)]
MPLAGRVAIVTGAGDGIGAAVARRFAADGAKVLVAEVNEEKGRATAEAIGGRFVRTDVSDKAQMLAVVDTAVQEWGSVDILVNNAWGAGNVGRVENKTDTMLAHGLGVGFYGPFWAMQAAFPHMKERGWGRVIFSSCGIPHLQVGRKRSSCGQGNSWDSPPGRIPVP